jgi:hypothetical protein
MDDLTASKLQTAYVLIKAGESDQACEILIPLVRANPNLVDGWFLLGHAVSNSQEKVRCFQQVLYLDPANQPAQKQLARLLAPQAVSPSIKTKPIVAEVAKKSVPKKRNPALLWGLAGLFISLSGFGFLWSFNNPLFASPAPTVPGSATSILSTVTLVASTLAPVPSISPKPTSRPTITLPPTRTPQPSLTALLKFTLTITETPDLTQAQLPKDFNDCLTPNGMSKQTAPFKIENLWKEKATVYINGVSRNGNYPIYCRKIISQGAATIITLMWGDYEYIVLCGSKTSRGSFFINQPNKATMRILEDKIQIGEFP